MPGGKPELRTLQDWISTYLRGVCMGCADLVPGISGGTVAFVLGFYANLINSLKSFNTQALLALCRLDARAFFDRIAWEFLLALGCGMATAILLLSNPFYFLLHHPIYRTFFYALFVGLTLSASLFCTRQIKKWYPSYYAIFFIFALAMFFVTFPRPSPPVRGPLYDVAATVDQFPYAASKVPLANYDAQSQRLTNIPETTLSAMLAKGTISGQTEVFNHTTGQTGPAIQFVKPAATSRINGWLFLCGVIGVCALLLPGISGSYILTVLGAYPILIAAIADLSQGFAHLRVDVDAFFILLSVFLGVMVGAICFSHLLSRLLKTHHDITIAALIGCMIGALPAIWPFWSYAYQIPPLRWDHAPQLQTVAPLMPDPASPYFAIAVVWVIIGFFTVLGLEQLKKDAV